MAAAAVRLINPDIKVTAHQAQLGPGTEKLFGSTFFRRLDGVVSALDTLTARECLGGAGVSPVSMLPGGMHPPLLPAGAYLESCCIRSRTALLDTGTEGAKGNVLAMVPPLSQQLEPGSDPADGSFPLCTLRFFPCAIEHTLQVWLWILAPGPLVSHPIPTAGCGPGCFLPGGHYHGEWGGVTVWEPGTQPRPLDAVGS